MRTIETFYKKRKNIGKRFINTQKAFFFFSIFFFWKILFLLLPKDGKKKIDWKTKNSRIVNWVILAFVVISRKQFAPNKYLPLYQFVFVFVKRRSWKGLEAQTYFETYIEWKKSVWKRQKV